MGRSYRYLHYDVFTDRVFGGNQLAVFPDGRGLPAKTMQAIAKEMNFSESTFVLPAERADTNVRMRIFTPGEELPMAGHPTIGSMFALVRTGLVQPPATQFVFGLGIGPVPVSLTWQGDELTFAWMTQSLPTFGPVLADVRGAAAVLSLPEDAVRRTNLPVQVVSCGLPFLLVPVASRREVDEAVLDRTAFASFTKTLGEPADCVFFFSIEAGDDGAAAYSRMFAPGLGIGEDPATGSASGPLGCYLVRHGVVTGARAADMLSLQGVKMGRPSHVYISIGLEGGQFTQVRVGGVAMFVGEGFVYL
jgi:trans-2,3-dihydro-3-hydroxyanthranilate isomerase